MSRVLVLLGRLCAIVCGFAAAVIAAALFLALLLVAASGEAETTPFFAQGPLYFAVAFLAAWLGYLAFLPAMAAILIGEFSGRRGWLFYALAGAAVALLLSAAAWQRADDAAWLDPALIPLLLCCGIVGGLAYWLVAGRNAGYWLEARRDS